MPRASLTQTFADRVKPALGACVDYFDERNTGLALRVTGPSKRHKHGLRTWRWTYRFAGKQLVITIGHAPSLSAEKAHAFAHKAKVLLDGGKDPAVLRPSLAPAPVPEASSPLPTDSVKEMVARYEIVLSRKSRAHYRNSYAYFNRFVLPQWGDRSVHDLKRRDIVDLLNRIAAAGHVISANRCASAIAHGAITSSARAFS